MSANELALELRVPATRMTEVVNGPQRHGRHSSSAGTVLRHDTKVLAEPLNLQGSYDLAVAAESKAREIERTVRPHAAA